MLVDTDVLIDYLRGKKNASKFIEKSIDEICVSAITVGELYQGVIEGKERVALDSLISAFVVLPVTEEIAKDGGLLRREYHRSHGAGLADCLIAATAKIHDLSLSTQNIKHYPMMSGIKKCY